jgi:tetratricopeptide (TPR) repeat protein
MPSPPARHPIAGRSEGRSRRATLLACLLAVPASLLSAGESGASPGLGTVHLPVSCATEVQPEFERAVAYLHHMTYRQAFEGFRAVAAADPDCAMAQWGIAMSQFQPLWPNRPGPEALARGNAAVDRALELGPPTERERLYVAAVAGFFRDTDAADHWERLRRWERGQETLYEAYPDDLEAAAFFALSHLATAPLASRPLDHNERAAEILLGILRRQPDHPGAVHYTIHANDAVGREHESLDVVRSYAEIAPDNPHALHMPTHIFVRLGAWQEVIDWNRRAAVAALAHPAGEHDELVSDEFPHAIEYLVYAALQLGDEATAVAAWSELSATSHLQPTLKTAFNLASIPARLALERHAWAEAAHLAPRRPDWVDWDRFPWPEAITWFARGLGAARLGDLPQARQAVDEMTRLRQVATDAGEAPFAREIEILRLEVSAWVALGEGDSGAAVARLREAVELEHATPKQPVTPAPELPADELLGDLLLELDRPGDAAEAYAAALRFTPGRRNSLEGAARAAAATSAEGLR